MAYTYNSSNVGSSDLATIRFLLQDTSSGDQQFDDNEIRYLDTLEGNVQKSAIRGALTLATKYAREVDKQVGNLRLAASDRAKMYRTLYQDLKRQSAITLPRVFAGGISISDRDTVASDSDRVVPAFVLGQFDHAGTATGSSS